MSCAPRTSSTGSAEPLSGERRPRVLLAYHANPTTTAAYLEAALRRVADVTTLGDRQDVAIPRDQPVHLPAVLARLGRDFDLYLEVEGENVDAHGHAEIGIPRAWWAIDSHLHTQFDFHYFRARWFDHVFVAQRRCVARYQDMAWVEASWLPLAADPAVFRPFPEEPRAFDVGFVGNVLPGLHAARLVALERLWRAFPRVLVARGLWREDAARALARCRLVFNRSLHEDVNMRVFEAVACGRPLLTDRLPAKCGLEECFADAEHVILYEDTDLERVATRWPADEERAEYIARAGRAHVLAHHTYDHRARELLRVMGRAPVPGAAVAQAGGAEQ